MRITMIHKLDDEQKEELKSEIGHVADDLREELDLAFANWKKMERAFTYALVGTGIVAFATGVVVGKHYG